VVLAADAGTAYAGRRRQAAGPGQVTEAWFAEDIIGMMLQLGIISLPT
jgi:hypothetical protein